MKKYILTIAACFCIVTIKAQNATTPNQAPQNQTMQLQKAPSLTNDQLKSQQPASSLNPKAIKVKTTDKKKAVNKSTEIQKATPADKSQTQILNLQK